MKHPPFGPLLRRGGKTIAVIGVILAVVAVRVVTGSQRELAEGQRFEREGDVAGAIVHYRRAVGWYTPMNPFVVDALDRLAAIGSAAEDEGDAEQALAAYRAIRAGILVSRSFYTPHQDRLDAANQRIAELLAQSDPPPIDAGKSPEELRREHLALLRETRRPNVGFTALSLLGFATWVGAAFLFARRAIDDEDRVVASEARKWGTAIIVGFGLFILGLALA